MIEKNEFLKLFVAGCNTQNLKSSNLFIIKDDDTIKLYNYSTIIAYSKNNKIYLNIKKYSQTTSRNQNAIKRLCNEMGVEIVEYE